MLEIYAHAKAVGQRDIRSTVDLLYRDIIPNKGADVAAYRKWVVDNDSYIQ